MGAAGLRTAEARRKTSVRAPMVSEVLMVVVGMTSWDVEMGTAKGGSDERAVEMI